MQNKNHIFCDKRTTTGFTGVASGYPFMAFTAFAKTSSGTGAFVGGVDASSDGVNWFQAFPLNIASFDSNGVIAGIAGSVPYRFVRARITTLSGTGAEVTIAMGYSPG